MMDFTTIAVEFPADCVTSGKRFVDILETTALVNPERRMRYNIMAVERTIEPLVESRKKRRQESCIEWYSQKEFDELIYDYMAVNSELTIADFLTLFRGFSSRGIQEGIVKTVKTDLKCPANFDKKLQFLPLSSVLNPMSLYHEIQQNSRDLEERQLPSFLGCVGDGFVKIASAIPTLVTLRTAGMMTARGYILRITIRTRWQDTDRIGIHKLKDLSKFCRFPCYLLNSYVVLGQTLYISQKLCYHFDLWTPINDLSSIQCQETLFLFSQDRK